MYVASEIAREWAKKVLAFLEFASAFQAQRIFDCLAFTSFVCHPPHSSYAKKRTFLKHFFVPGSRTVEASYTAFVCDFD